MQNTGDLHDSAEKHITAEFWGEHGTFVTVGLGQLRAFHDLQLAVRSCIQACDWAAVSGYERKQAKILTSVLI